MSFRTSAGDSFGTIVADMIVPAPQSLRDRRPTLRDAIAAGSTAELSKTASARAQEPVPLNAVELLPPIPRPERIICIGRNYRAHAAESGAQPTEHPSFFIRLPGTLVAHDKPVLRPLVSESFDFEGELAIVIGTPGRHISEADALDHILGYACFMDGSIRDYQFDHSIAAGKNFDSTAGFGPWITTADEVGDPSALEIVTRLSGKQVQHGLTRDMLFGPAALIAYLSRIMPLEPGDVIATGTPEGVGFARKPPLWMRPGDVIEVDIPGVGVLRNPVQQEPNR